MSARPTQNQAATAAAVAASSPQTNGNFQSTGNAGHVTQYHADATTGGHHQGSQQQTTTSSQQQSSSSSSGNGQVVGLHYKIGKKIGEGSFGVIFEGTNLINGIPVAIKFEPRKTEAPQLRDEYRTYMHLIGVPGIPTAYYFGQEGLHNILVIDLLGPSLEDLFDWCGRKFSVKTVVQVSVQMITLIQGVHEHDLIYRDIKPDNFLIGRRGMPDENLVHLVDFGMAKRYRDARTKKHIPYREKKSLSGTARYMSVNTHLGREQSRRDDMEALGHVFFYFLKGQLPWQGLKAPTNKQKYEKIGEKKRTTPINDLCSGFPPQFGVYLQRVRALQFEEEPDYEGYRQLLMSALDDIGETADGHYDWMDLNGGRGWDSTINKKPNLHGYGHPNPPGHRHAQRRTRTNQQYYQSAHHHHSQAAQQANANSAGQQAATGAATGAAGQQATSAHYHHHQAGTGDRPLPNLPHSDAANAHGSQQAAQAGQYSSQQAQYSQQPAATTTPVAQKQTQPELEEDDKGFFSKMFSCC